MWHLSQWLLNMSHRIRWKAERIEHLAVYDEPWADEELPF